MSMVCCMSQNRVFECGLTFVCDPEVQDQRPLEIELLLNLVNNPQGIHFGIYMPIPAMQD